MIKKIKYMIEMLAHLIIIYIDYFAATSIVKQINLNMMLINKLNFYLI